MSVRANLVSWRAGSCQHEKFWSICSRRAGRGPRRSGNTLSVPPCFSGGILSISHCHCGSTLRSVRPHCHCGSTLRSVRLHCNCGSTVAVPNRSSPRNQRPSPRRSHSAADPPHEPEFERDVELLFPVPYEK